MSNCRKREKVKDMICKECYSQNSRITPILEPEKCLRNHTQYICSTCGRCICIDHDEKRDVYRWNFPFKALDIAKLYLKTAEIVCQGICGIYETDERRECGYVRRKTMQRLRHPWRG